MGRWSFSEKDTVLSLGLSADSPAAVVDALDAPLAAGARLGFSESLAPDSPEQAFSLWKAIYETPEASVIFMDSRWCWKFLDAHAQLSAQITRELERRREEGRLRLAV